MRRGGGDDAAQARLDLEVGRAAVVGWFLSVIWIVGVVLVAIAAVHLVTTMMRLAM